MENNGLTMGRFNWYFDNQLVVMEHRLKYIFFLHLRSNIRVVPRREVDKVVDQRRHVRLQVEPRYGGLHPAVC